MSFFTKNTLLHWNLISKTKFCARSLADATNATIVTRFFRDFQKTNGRSGRGSIVSELCSEKKRCSGKIVGLTCCAILSNLLYVYDIHVHILFNTYYIHGIHRFKIWHRSSITTFHSFNLHCMRLHSKVQDMLYAWNSYIEHTPCG
mgnify:CR=1 FL=1